MTQLYEMQKWREVEDTHTGVAAAVALTVGAIIATIIFDMFWRGMFYKAFQECEHGKQYLTSKAWVRQGVSCNSEG